MSKSLTEIQGFEELHRKIQKLGNDKQKKKEMLKVLGQVANPTVKAAKANVRVSSKPHLISGKRTKQLIQPGTLRKSIGKIRGRKGRGKENAVLYVGTRAKGKWNGWYGHFVEFGTKKYKKGPQPFMAKAYKQTGGAVTRDAEVKVAKYIQKQIKKLSN